MLSPWGRRESDPTERPTHFLLVSPKDPAESLQAGPLSLSRCPQRLAGSLAHNTLSL